jgi:hypothetical protein
VPGDTSPTHTGAAVVEAVGDSVGQGKAKTGRVRIETGQADVAAEEAGVLKTILDFHTGMTVAPTVFAEEMPRFAAGTCVGRLYEIAIGEGSQSAVAATESVSAEPVTEDAGVGGVAAETPILATLSPDTSDRRP